MCGIAGYFGHRALPSAAVLRMMEALRQRGPDAEHAVFFGPDLRRTEENAAPNALLHTRLSIIDPRPIADQPMGNDDGTMWICYNGEVYGWQSAARELEGKGVRFATWCDTDTRSS
jgi:asparagine synthase (glutamine-hydrolysing)